MSVAAGVVTDLNKAITREQAARFLYNALFSSQVTCTPAFGYTDSYFVSSKGSLAYEVFGVISGKAGEAGQTVDNWGRPGTVWYLRDVSGNKLNKAAAIYVVAA